MTRYDLRIAGIVLTLIVVLGLAIGFLVGTLTKSDLRVADVDTSIATEFTPAAAGEDKKRSSNPWVPGYENIYVNDYADLLEANAEANITAKLKSLYRRSGVEMTVLTIGTMNNYNHSGAIEPFATELFNDWGIGNAARNDGVLILVSRYDRQMRIELGSGYDQSWDAKMQKVIDWKFLTKFRQDLYQQGIVEGVDETIYQIAGDPDEGAGLGVVQRGWRSIWGTLLSLGDWIWAIGAVPVAGAVFAVRSYLRRRPKPCGRCSTLMLRMGEEADDEHLDGGQKLEEYLKSIDYDVWKCPNCADMRITRHKGWFSRASNCPRCQYHTMFTKTKTLEMATTTSFGKERVDYDCRHCDYTATETRKTPMKQKSSSGSSSGGGSSFGGGSSSGGGASGSW